MSGLEILLAYADSDHATCLLGQQPFGVRKGGSACGGLGCLVLKDETGGSIAAFEAGSKCVCRYREEGSSISRSSSAIIHHTEHRRCPNQDFLRITKGPLNWPKTQWAGRGRRVIHTVSYFTMDAVLDTGVYMVYIGT